MNTKLVGGKRILSKKLKWDYTLKGLEKTYTDFLYELNFNSDLVLQKNDIGVKVVMNHKSDQFILEIFYLNFDTYVKHNQIIFKSSLKDTIAYRECYINQKQFTFDIDKVAKEIMNKIRECWELSYG